MERPGSVGRASASSVVSQMRSMASRGKPTATMQVDVERSLSPTGSSASDDSFEHLLTPEPKARRKPTKSTSGSRLSDTLAPSSGSSPLAARGRSAERTAERTAPQPIVSPTKVASSARSNTNALNVQTQALDNHRQRVQELTKQLASLRAARGKLAAFTAVSHPPAPAAAAMQPTHAPTISPVAAAARAASSLPLHADEEQPDMLQPRAESLTPVRSASAPRGATNVEADLRAQLVLAGRQTAAAEAEAAALKARLTALERAGRARDARLTQDAQSNDHLVLAIQSENESLKAKLVQVQSQLAAVQSKHRDAAETAATTQASLSSSDALIAALRQQLASNEDTLVACRNSLEQAEAAAVSWQQQAAGARQDALNALAEKDRLRHQLDAAQEQVQALRREQAKEPAAADVRRQLAAVGLSHEEAQKELAACRTQLQALRAHNTSLSSQLQTANRRAAAADVRVEELDRELATARREVQLTQDQLVDAAAKCTDVDVRLLAMQREVDRLTTQCAEADATAAALTEELQAAAADRQALQERLDEARRKLSLSESSTGGHQELVASLEAQTATLQRRLRQETDTAALTAQRLTEAQTALHDAQVQLSARHAKLAAAEARLGAAEKAASRHRQREEELTSQLADAQATVQHLLAAAKEATTHAVAEQTEADRSSDEALAARTATLEAELRTLQDSLRAATAASAAHETTAAAVTAQLTSIQDALAEARRQLATTQQQLSHAESENRQLVTSRDRAAARVTALTEAHRTTADRCAELEQQLSVLATDSSKATAGLLAISKARDALAQEADELRARLSRSDDDRKHLLDELAAAQRAASLAQDELAHVQQVSRDLDGSVRRLAAVNDALRSECATLATSRDEAVRDTQRAQKLADAAVAAAKAAQSQADVEQHRSTTEASVAALLAHVHGVQAALGHTGTDLRTLQEDVASIHSLMQRAEENVQIVVPHVASVQPVAAAPSPSPIQDGSMVVSTAEWHDLNDQLSTALVEAEELRTALQERDSTIVDLYQDADKHAVPHATALHLPEEQPRVTEDDSTSLFGSLIESESGKLPSDDHAVVTHLELRIQQLQQSNKDLVRRLEAAEAGRTLAEVAAGAADGQMTAKTAAVTDLETLMADLTTQLHAVHQVLDRERELTAALRAQLAQAEHTLQQEQAHAYTLRKELTDIHALHESADDATRRFAQDLQAVSSALDKKTLEATQLAQDLVHSAHALAAAKEDAAATEARLTRQLAAAQEDAASKAAELDLARADLGAIQQRFSALDQDTAARLHLKDADIQDHELRLNHMRESLRRLQAELDTRDADFQKLAIAFTRLVGGTQGLCRRVHRSVRHIGAELAAAGEEPTPGGTRATEHLEDEYVDDFESDARSDAYSDTFEPVEPQSRHDLRLSMSAGALEVEDEVPDKDASDDDEDDRDSSASSQRSNAGYVLGTDLLPDGRASGQQALDDDLYADAAVVAANARLHAAEAQTPLSVASARQAALLRRREEVQTALQHVRATNPVLTAKDMLADMDATWQSLSDVMRHQVPEALRLLRVDVQRVKLAQLDAAAGIDDDVNDADDDEPADPSTAALVASLESENGKLRRALDDAAAEIAQQAADLEAAYRQEQILSHTLDERLQELGAATHSLEALQHQHKACNQALEDLRLELAAHVTAAEESTRQQAQLQTDKVGLAQQVADLQYELSHRQQEVDELQQRAQVMSSPTTVQRLQSALASAQRQLEEPAACEMCDDMRAALESMETMLGQQSEHIRGLDATVDDLRDRLDTSEQQERQYSLQVEGLQVVISGLKQQLDAAGQQVVALELQLVQRSAHVTSLQASTDAALDKITELQAQLAAAEQRCNSSEATLKECQQQLADHDALAHQVHELQAQVAAHGTLQATVEDLRQELAQHAAHAEQLERSRSQLQSTVREQQQELAHLADAMEAATAKIHMLDKTIDDQRQELAHHVKHTSELECSAALLSQQLAAQSKADQTAELTATVEELRQELAHSASGLEHAVQRESQLQRTVQEQQRELAALAADMESETRTVHVLQKTVSEQQAELAAQVQHVNALELEKAQLAQRLTNQSAVAAEQQDLQAQLSQASEQISQLVNAGAQHAAHAAQLERDKQALQQLLQVATARATDLDAQHSQLSVHVAELQHELAHTVQAASVAERTQTQLQLQVSDLQNELAETVQLTEQHGRQHATAQSQLQVLQTELGVAVSALEAIGASEAQLKAQHQALADELAKTVAAAEGAVKAEAILASECAQLRHELGVAVHQSEQAHAEHARIAAHLQVAQQQLAAGTHQVSAAVAHIWERVHGLRQVTAAPAVASHAQQWADVEAQCAEAAASTATLDSLTAELLALAATMREGSAMQSEDWRSALVQLEALQLQPLRQQVVDQFACIETLARQKQALVERVAIAEFRSSALDSSPTITPVSKK